MVSHAQLEVGLETQLGGARFELLVDKLGGEVDALCHAAVVESEQTLVFVAHGEGARRRGGDDALGVA